MKRSISILAIAAVITGAAQPSRISGGTVDILTEARASGTGSFTTLYALGIPLDYTTSGKRWN